jgi:hypothetical protein
LNARECGDNTGCNSEVIRKEIIMEDTARLKYLKIALVLVGVFCAVGVYPLTILWPSGWVWHGEGQSLYLQMIIGIYATLGVFLIIAARNPLEHLSLIWFAVWSSIVHGGIMAIQALVYPEHVGHLFGDVPVLLIAAAVFAFLTPRGKARTTTQR